MVDLEIGDAEIIARGSAGTVSIDVAGWSPTKVKNDIGRIPIDAACSGYVSKFQLSSENYDSRVTIRSMDGDILNVDGIGEEDLLYKSEAVISDIVKVPKGLFRLRKTIGMITMYSLISGPCVIDIRKKWKLEVIPLRPTLVTFGFRDNKDHSAETITVPYDADGLSTAISYFRAGLRTLTPDRSFLTFRAPPPRIEFGKKCIPSSLKKISSASNIEFICPKRVETVAATASAAYYLGATVRVEDVDNTVLRIAENEFVLHFSKMPDYQLEIGEILKRVLWLDSIGRNSGDYGNGLEDVCVSDFIEIETDRLYDLTSEDRLIRYMEVDYGALSEITPPWNLGVRINTTPNDLKMLPDLARQLAIIYPTEIPSNIRSPRKELVTTSGPCNERLFGMSTSLNSYEKSAKDGFFHLQKAPHPTRSNLPEKESIVITLIRNDESTDDRYSLFIRERVNGLEIPLEINKLTNANCEELESVLRNPTDYVIFVGETDGACLVCEDGNLSIESINTICAEFLMVDAPDSIETGLAATDRGVRTAIVGTDSKEWRSIGPAPIGFSLLGFGLADATRLACNFTDSTASVSVIGDGMATHRATSGTGMSIIQISEEPILTLAAIFFPTFPGTDQILNSTPGYSGANKLAGNVYTRQVSPKNLAGTIEVLEEPIIYNDDLYWPDERFQLINPVI